MGDAAENAFVRRALASEPEAEKVDAPPTPGPTTPLIEKTPGVVGGSACVARTRIPVWTLENYRRLGLNDAGILDSFPVLRAVDLAAAWSYVDAHPDEIKQDIQENDAA